MKSTIRVYLPATFPALAQLRDRGELAAPVGYAVTAGLGELLGLLGDDDADLLAYEAFQLAAAASLELVRADPAAARRRVVVSADAPARPDGGAGQVALAGPVPLTAVAAIHVDGTAAEPEVAAGDPVEHELEWYDVSELAQLLA